MTRRPARGFTLIEVMVVIAIIGVLTGLFIGLSGRTYGTNADSIADEVAAQLQFAHTRAASTRHYQCVELKPQEVVLYQSTTTGMVGPPIVTDPCSASDAYWQRVSSLSIPKGTSIWSYDPTVYGSAGSATPTQNTGLDSFALIFKPDGSSTGGTVFLADTTGSRRARIVVYKTTGDAYVRHVW